MQYRLHNQHWPIEMDSNLMQIFDDVLTRGVQTLRHQEDP